jgi:hypothetical protein
MLKQLNIKHILFYTLSITGVVVLFNFITTYAQTNLKISPKLSGIYEIETKSLSECLSGSKLILKIQQSGLYLNGLLVSGSSEIANALSEDEELPLVGHFKDPEVTLKGKATALKGCPSADREGQVVIKATGKKQKLTGVLTSGNLSLPFETIARVQNKLESKKVH